MHGGDTITLSIALKLSSDLVNEQNHIQRGRYFHLQEDAGVHQHQGERIRFISKFKLTATHTVTYGVFSFHLRFNRVDNPNTFIAEWESIHQNRWIDELLIIFSSKYAIQTTLIELEVVDQHFPKLILIHFWEMLLLQFFKFNP